MGMEKYGSRSGSGFFQMFDWNAKSRKKLFSSKSDLPEQSKQKKMCDRRSFPATQIHMLDEDEMIAGSSIRGSSDYSRASSVTDDDFCGTKAPGVVARLMGLDSMPTSNFSEPYSSPFLYSQSLRDAHHHEKNLECSQDSQNVHSGRHKELASVRNFMVQNQKSINRPMEKFQTEILPPKSAKSIPITHHKLLSPIKSANFIPFKDAAYIMEAAARIIEPGPQANRKEKLPQVGSSSAPLRVKNLKEKVQSAQSSSKLSEASRKPGETNFAKYFKAQSINVTSINVFTRSEDCSTDIKNKGKSISLALQAKANVQKREGLNSGSSRCLVHREHSVFNSKQSFKSQQNTQKITHKKPSTHSGSSVLRQNNQKENCVNAERGKLHSKSLASNLQDGKALSGATSVRQRNYSKTSGNSKFGARRSVSDTRDDRREVSCSSSERVSRKKRSVDGHYQYEKNVAANNGLMDKNQKLIQSNALMDQQNRWDQDTKINGTDVVSFTFTTPMKGPGCERTRETREQCNDFSENYRTKRMLLSSDGMNKFSFPGNNVNGGDTLSTLLEQKFKELTYGAEFSEHKVAPLGSSASIFHDPIPGLNSLRTSEVLHDNRTKDRIHTDGVIGLGGSRFPLMNECGNRTEIKMLLDCRLPSPVSVLDHSSVTESFTSSDTAESSTVGGRQYTSFQAQEVLGMYSLKKLQSLEGDAELSDSASSISAEPWAKKHVTTISSFAIDSGESTGWELEYVKDILCNIELMFKDYALGRACEVINPHHFYQLESRKLCFNGHGLEEKISRKALFDCVTECLDSRCRRYISGGCKIWTEGLLVVRRKDRLAEEVYNEISSWSCMKDSMVDELVDKDMSSKHKRWLDFDIEAFELGILIEDRILTSLLDEVVDDILVL